MRKETYTPTDWKDHVVQKPKTYNMIENEDGTVTLHPAPGTIEQQGTPITATNLNNMENGIIAAIRKANFLTEEEVASIVEGDTEELKEGYANYHSLKYFFLHLMNKLTSTFNTFLKKDEIANNLTTTTNGFVLDARQGKALREIMTISSVCTAVLKADGWEGQDPAMQTVAAAGVTADAARIHLFPSPAPTHFTAYSEAQVRATAQGNETVTFSASDIPETDITVNLLIVDSGVSE